RASGAHEGEPRRGRCGNRVPNRRAVRAKLGDGRGDSAREQRGRRIPDRGRDRRSTSGARARVGGFRSFFRGATRARERRVHASCREQRIAVSAGRFDFERRALAASGGVLVAFLAVPLVALFVTTTVVDFGAGLLHPLVWPALRLSLLTTFISLVLVVV